MNKFKNSFFYIGTIGVFSILIYWIIVLGVDLEVGRNIVIPQSGKSQWAEFLEAMAHNLKYPLAILLAQIVTIILAARLFGWICRKIGQPSVIGEIDKSVRRKMVALPNGYGSRFRDGEAIGPQLNMITPNSHCESFTKTPFHKYLPVKITKLVEA